MNKLNKIFITIAVILLASCAGYPKPIPDGYRGPLATIYDTKQDVSRTRVYFFELEKVEERLIKTSSWETFEYNYNKGFKMTAQLNNRKIPAGKTVLTLAGITHVAADILRLTGGMYSVRGDATVTLEEGKKYYVRGKLSRKYSAVWLEDEDGNIISEKIEKKK